MSYYYNAKVTLLDKDYEKLVELSNQPENEGLKDLLSCAEVGHYMEQTVLVFDNYNHFDPYFDDSVGQLYEFLEETGCAKVTTLDEEGCTGRDTFLTDNEKLKNFDPGVIWFDGVFEGVKFTSLADSLLKVIEEEMKKECNRDEVKTLDEKELKSLIKMVTQKIKDIVPSGKDKSQREAMPNGNSR